MTDKVHEELTPDICKTCTKDETKCGTCPATIAWIEERLQRSFPLRKEKRMKLIIDIPEEEYSKTLQGEFNVTLAHKAVKNGKPLDGVLDKIRAEIQAKCCITVGRENDGAITLRDVFEIIDKYKEESEEE